MISFFGDNTRNKIFAVESNNTLTKEEVDNLIENIDKKFDSDYFNSFSFYRVDGFIFEFLIYYL